MRIIDADDFYKPFEEGKKTLEAIGSVLPEELLDAVLGIYDEIKERLDATPTIDAVEVVRCKDCKYSVDYYNDGDCYCRRPEREMVWIGQKWDFFCAAGRRRTSDDQ